MSAAKFVWAISRRINTRVFTAPRLTFSPNEFVLTAISAMNAFPAGTRVFFWTSNGDVEYATVQSSSRLPDGTQILVLQLESRNVTATLPAIGVTKVS